MMEGYIVKEKIKLKDGISIFTKIIKYSRLLTFSNFENLLLKIEILNETTDYVSI